MERTIGNLAQEIRQPSNPYSNLAWEGIHHCQINSLLAAVPELSIPSRPVPNSTVDLGDGFILLPKQDRYFILPSPCELEALQNSQPEGAPPLERIK